MDMQLLSNDVVPEDLVQKLKKELNETDEEVQKGLSSLKEFLSNESISWKPDDAFLLQCLRAQKFNSEKSSAKLKQYCKFRKFLREMYKDMDLKKIRLVLDSQIVGLLRYRDSHGRAIFYSRAHAWKPELFDMNDVTQCAIALLHFACTFPLTTMTGITYIADTRVNSFQDYFIFFSAFRTLIPVLLAMPVRFQRFEVMNENFLIRSFYQLIRPLIPTKLTKRVSMNGENFSHLEKNYSLSLFPYELGGTLGPLSNEHYKDSFLQFLQKFKSDLE